MVLFLEEQLEDLELISSLARIFYINERKKQCRNVYVDVAR